jgi:hypothetical protein
MLKVGDVITAKKVGRGKFVVIDARWGGGGTGHGPGDSYPDGLEVTLRKFLPGNAQSVARLGKKHVRYEDNTGCFKDSEYLGTYTVVGKVKLELIITSVTSSIT